MWFLAAAPMYDDDEKDATNDGKKKNWIKCSSSNNSNDAIMFASYLSLQPISTKWYLFTKLLLNNTLPFIQNTPLDIYNGTISMLLP